MARPSAADLIQLLAIPSESLTVEHKGWLNLSLNPHKAILAKAAIALANEGGGIIVIGTREDNTQGGALGSYARPAELSRYSLDDINSAIARFADPEFHCQLVFAEHPDTKVDHAFVIVPGGMTVPVMSGRGSDGEIQAHRCYVRKPGPRSEEPYTAEEWRGVFERCLQTRRESMLDAIRVIVQGHGDTVPVAPTTRAALLDFTAASQARWLSLVEPLPPDDPARMPDGHYEITFSILGVEPTPSLAELRRRIEEASRIKLTGWTPFIHIHRPPFEPRPIDGKIEAWVGDPNGERGIPRDSAHCDFWRADRTGNFFLLRGYDEDSSAKVKAGTALDLVLPIWRVGETLLFASRVARLFGDNPEILMTCQYNGLRNRRLVSLTHFLNILDWQGCADDNVTLETRATAQQVEDNLVEVLHPTLQPLYERFSFFELNPKLVIEQVEELRRNRF
jgi:hypothetical protein